MLTDFLLKKEGKMSNKKANHPMKKVTNTTSIGGCLSRLRFSVSPRGSTTFSVPWKLNFFLHILNTLRCGCSKGQARQEDRDSWLAAELIRSLQPPEGLKVIVVFDTYSLCPLVVWACQTQRFHFVSTLKANRNLFLHHQKRKAGEWARGLFQRTAKSTLRIPKEHGSAHYRYVDAGRRHVSKLGMLHIVISKKNKERMPVLIVTDHPSFSAARIIHAYDARWNIEVFFKDTKQLLGLGHYQNRPYTAAVTHLHLVCFAYALLTHIAIESSCAQEKQPKQARESTSVLQNRLRCIVWEDTAQYLKDLPEEKSVFKELSRLLIAA